MMRLTKRPFLLLEALIAFALVALCAIPLVYPHVGMLKAQRQFVHTVELDQVVNLLYADVMEKLFLNKIGWTDILGVTHEVNEATLREMGYVKPFPYLGSYQFTEVNHKPKKEEAPYKQYLFRLTFKFVPKYNRNMEKPLTYEYNVFAVRDLRPKGTK